MRWRSDSIRFALPGQIRHHVFGNTSCAGGAVRKFFRRVPRSNGNKASNKNGSHFEPGPNNIKWIIWRPVLAQLGKLNEVRYEWNIDDLFDAHEVLDIKEEAEQFLLTEARQRAAK